MALVNESLTAEEQNDEASEGTNHQVPTVPMDVNMCEEKIRNYLNGIENGQKLEIGERQE